MSKIEAIRVTKDQKVTEELASLNLKKKLLIDWFSGLVGGFVSVTCCAPLDVARTRHMVLVRVNPLFFEKIGYDKKSWSN